MLFLMFRLGEDRYLLDTARVSAVLPLVALKALPGAPAGVAGAFNYRGTPVPVIDLAKLALGREATQVLSTRIVLIEDEEGRLLGLIAEEAVATVERSRAEFRQTGLEAGLPAYLGPVVADEHGLLQWIRPGDLLPPEIRDALDRRLQGEAP